MKQTESTTVASEREPVSAADHPLVGQLRELLSDPATAEFGKLLGLVQRIHAEMTVTGGPLPMEPEAGGAAPASPVKAGTTGEVENGTRVEAEPRLRTGEQQLADGNLPLCKAQQLSADTPAHRVRDERS
jgi:hypothetical protein